jgi:hypothetical protein
MKTRRLSPSFTQAEAANNQSLIPSTVRFLHRSRLEGCGTLHPRSTHEQQKPKICRKPYKDDERLADRGRYLIHVAANNVPPLEYRVEKWMRALSVNFFTLFLLVLSPDAQMQSKTCDQGFGPWPKYLFGFSMSPSHAVGRGADFLSTPRERVHG